MIALIGVTAGVFTAAVLAHLALTHVTHNARYVRNAFLVFGVFCLVALPLAAELGLLGALVLYGALVILWNSYLVFFINLINSVSLRMVSEIERSPTGSLSIAEVTDLYSDEEALETRLRALVANGFLIDRGDAGLELTARGAWFARFLELVRKVFGIESFG